METRHTKMIGYFLAFFLVTLWMGFYLFVSFHYGHILSFFIIVPLQILAVLLPGVLCDGYDMRDPNSIISGTAHTSVDSYLTCRDTGYAMSMMMYLITYVIPTTIWYGSRGVSLTYGAVLIIYIANTCLAIAAVIGYTILVVTFEEK